MAVQQLPPQPSLKSLRNQAKQLLHGHRAGRRDACERLLAMHPRLAGLSTAAVQEEDLALADALLVVAREYGFDSWPKLTEAVFAQSEWPDFANPPGWEWVLKPNLNSPIGANGSTGGDGYQMSYRHHPDERSLYVYFAASLTSRPDLAERPVRAVGVDEQTRRHELAQLGGGRSGSLRAWEFELRYSQVPHGSIWYLGIEAKTA